MDLIVELIKAIVAAFEESKKKKELPPPIARQPAANENYEALAKAQRRIVEKQEALRRQREAAQAVQDQPAPPRARPPGATTEPQPRVSRPTSSAQRLARLLRQPSTVREVIILSELLGPPKALRRGRR